MTVGGILGEAWQLYVRFFARFVTLALIVFAVVDLLNALVATFIGGSAGVAVLVALVTTAVSLVGTFWLQGALAYAVEDVLDGRIDTGVGQLFERVQPHLGTLIPAGLLAAIGIAIGFFLLIVPGLILLTWWALIVPVIVFERRDIGESFGRSRELVRDHGWTVFGVVLVTAILSAVASGVVQGIFSFLGIFLRYWIGGMIASALVAPFSAIAMTLVYFKLRDLREGTAPDAGSVI